MKERAVAGGNGKRSSSEKIKTLEELSALLDRQRSGKKIVHCHGVFDLLHVGHIRHFEEAKRMGDILVVTLTPDQHVNKGPNRPAFKQDLRLETIAALECVDYVALNKWPKAVDTIRLLKPHVYAKGPDYKKMEKDVTGGIYQEEEAVKSVGGKIAFTEDITFSSSNLINKFFPAFSKEVSDYLEAFRGRHDISNVLAYLENARPLKVLVVGETIIDEYQFCTAIGKSSKEPIIALKHNNTERFAGGVLAVGNHLANFCGKVQVLSYLGKDNSHEDFVRANLDGRVEGFFVKKENSPTIVKRRFIESYFFTKMLEVYEINDRDLNEKENRDLCAFLKRELPNFDVVIVFDFGHGMMTAEAINLLCTQSKFLALNVQSNAGNLGYQTVLKYLRADYVCMAENEVRLEIRDRSSDLKDVIAGLYNKLSCQSVMVTRGKNGCLAYNKHEGFVAVPALATQVVDRMGTGDAFLSITALCVKQKAPLDVVGLIGNAVGAQAVATVGHSRFIEKAPLLKHIETLMK
jgi:rfaE bifunctional protein kinase chain/domain/rfaE bifunctional protein nucleotidyltransferase chain/domain